MKLSKRESILTVILFFLACFALYYNFYFFPIKEEISAAKSQVTELQKSIEDIQKKQGLIDQARTRLTEVKEENRTILARAPVGFNEAANLVSISGILSGLGEELSVTYEEASEAGDFYEAHPVTLSFITTEDSLETVLSKFQTEDYLNRPYLLEMDFQHDSAKNVVINMTSEYISLLN